MGAIATLGSRYETIRPLASGGMATVYLGRTVGVGGFERLVAIKKMHPHIAADGGFVQMFLDEARLAAQIRHPNVVATIDVEEGADGLFLVMEYVEGASVTQLIRSSNRQGQRLPVGIVLRVIIDVLTGLQAAHELCGPDGKPVNLVHRDISPPNILVGIDGVARILDFGVARAEARLSSTRDGMLKGKVSYMPPEQLLGQGVDARADVYATGVVLWEMLTGRRLFVGDDPGMLISRVQGGAENSPRVVAPEVPEAIDAACMAALRQHAERFPSASAFADALEAAAQECGVTIASARQVAPYAKGATSSPGTAAGSSSGQRVVSMTPTPSHARAIASGVMSHGVSIPIVEGTSFHAGPEQQSSKSLVVAIASLAGVIVIALVVFLAVRAPRAGPNATNAPAASSSAAANENPPAEPSAAPAPTLAAAPAAPAAPQTAAVVPATPSPAAAPVRRTRTTFAAPAARPRAAAPAQAGKYHPLEP